MKKILFLLIVMIFISGCNKEEIKGSTAMLSGMIEIEDLKEYKQELLNKENEIKDEEEKQENKQENNKEENKQDNKEETVNNDIETNEDKIVQYYVDKKSSTYTGRSSLSQVEYTVKDPLNKKGLSTNKFSFSFGAAKDGKPHSITVDNQAIFDRFGTNALAWDNKTSSKVLYLTFDCGYEYKNLTSVMLDTLKEKGIKGAFFVTDSYLRSSPQIVARMINEGHIVGNHTVTHPSDSAILPKEQLASELLGVHNNLLANFGYKSKYFRFPTGAYSECAIDLVNNVGYRSVFWSIAHTDWDPDNQSGVDVSFETVTSRLHPGAVILLHTTSPDNAQILGDFIDYALSQGYEFRSLDQYSNWD